MNIQKNNHAAHTKIEIENVLPTEIEKRSFEIITEELEQEGIVLPEIQAPITKRCIHTSADFDYAKNLVYSEHAVEKALEAIRGGASIVTDTQMGRSGINKRDWHSTAVRYTVLCRMKMWRRRRRRMEQQEPLPVWKKRVNGMKS